MSKIFERTEIIIKSTGVDLLQNKHVLIAGIGAVGSFAAESLVRAGVGKFTLIDFDVVQESNINRQIVALHSTLGMNKAVVMGQRMKDINPQVEIRIIEKKIEEKNVAEIITSDMPDYIVDAIDTVCCKVALMKFSYRNRIPIISSMGAGRKIDPTKIVVDDISKSTICPLARRIRSELKKNEIYKGIQVVYSTETPLSDGFYKDKHGDKYVTTNGTISYIPAIMGPIMAGVVINNFLGV